MYGIGNLELHRRGLFGAAAIVIAAAEFGVIYRWRLGLDGARK